ncbi:histidine phosphatase family protein [Calidifontibacter sp. DB0510]|uniref:Histidine phosphatase family protein n=1 Tax=Metallococcus carri TaxID=1656884 RepID=A0A967AZK9_9MICO|nr:histidine phosphatase family protein [Metallococcus carri]NHN54725.1 histidine phosphatase family protein [Metallococcus carri]NOP37070.1 histidine phosphatase family protein [Calidifontibacter sp. DB2511S]
MNAAENTNSLVLIRHGETEWSKSGRHTGLTDLPLLPVGEDGARRAGDLLTGMSFVAVFSSPLIRARRTAELAGLTGIQLDDDLLEWDYGGYEGLTTPQIREQTGDPDWEIFKNGVVPGKTPGETVEDVAARASHVVQRAMPLLQKGNVALVAHGHLLRILTAVFLRQEPRFGAQLMLDAGAVSKLGFYHGKPALQVWNRQTRE